MKKLIKDHNDWIKSIVKQREENKLNQEDLEKCIDYHNKIIEYLQHERLVHLLVTFSVALMVMGIAITSFFVEEILISFILGLLILLLIPYIGHYYKLENTVQTWYNIATTLYKDKDFKR